MIVGVRVAGRLRRWSPRVSSDLTEYDPGPDFIDWAQAALPTVLGVALLGFALVG